MGLNHLIYPEVLAANEIEESLRTNWMRYHLHLCQGALELCIVKVRETAKILGQSFASGVYNHGKYRIVAIKRDQQTIIPRGQDTVEVNDLVY
jgi:trk system potassium uptake protein TrkA